MRAHACRRDRTVCARRPFPGDLRRDRTARRGLPRPPGVRAATRQDIVSERTTQSTWQNPGYAHTKFTNEQGEAPLLPGDILYFGTGITHVGLYLGDGKVVEAPNSGDVVRVADATTQWNDNGLVMRACGTNGKGGTIACTGWY
ncbi:NlpC/P60 family protein [Kribbella sp. NPDC020789]